MCQCLHGLIGARKEPRIQCVFREIDTYVIALLASIHRKSHMNGVRCLEEFAKNLHFLRIKKIESVDPNLGSVQKGRVFQLLRKTIHAIGLIGQASLHAHGEFVHDKREFREFLRESLLRMRAVLRCIPQKRGTQAIAFEFCNGTCDGFGKAPLANGTCEDGELIPMTQQDILKQDTSADFTDSRQMRPPCFEEYLTCETSKAEHIGLQKARTVRQSLGKRTLRRIGHMLRNEEDALSSERLAYQNLCHRRQRSMRLARACTSDDKLEFCRHNASKPPCVKRALLPFAVRRTSRCTGIRARSSST